MGADLDQDGGEGCEAMPSPMAELPEQRHQAGRMERGGGPHIARGSQAAREQVDGDFGVCAECCCREEREAEEAEEDHS